MNPANRRRMLGLPLALLAARASGTGARQPPLRIVATFSILSDLLVEVGQGRVEIETLVGPDSDAHVFEPRPRDVRNIARAEMVVVNGLGFEGWMDRLVRASGAAVVPVVASSGVVPRTLGGQPDPHAWQDLSNAARYVHNLATALTRLRPGAAWLDNANAYLTKLQALDRDIRNRFKAIPRDRRRVMTSHDAFGYFGATYGIDFIAPLGMNTDTETSAATVARLVRQVRAQGIRAVFIENITDPRLVEQIARESGVTVGGRLYSDALSRPGSEADTYLKLFDHNASVIAAALERRS